MNQNTIIDHATLIRLASVYKHFADPQHKKMNVHKLMEALSVMKLNPTKGLIASVSSPYMETGVVEEIDFLNIYEQCVKSINSYTYTEQDIVSGLSEMCPADSTGFASKTALHELLTTKGDPLTAEEADELLNKLENLIGEIDLENLVNSIRNLKTD